MKCRKITIYDDTYDNEMWEDEREFLFDEYGEEQNWKTKDDVPDEWISESLSYCYDEDWHTFRQALENLLNKHACIIVGTAGLWYGRVAGGKFIKNWYDFTRTLEDCDNVKVWEENGHLFVNGYHHDGTNQFEIKYLTSKGEEFAENNWWEHDMELHEKIFKYNLFSGTPKLAKSMGFI